MTIRIGLFLSLSLSVASSARLAGGPARPVGEYGGRAIGADIAVLDVSRPALLRIDRATLACSERPLSGADQPLDPYGLALPGDGTAWTLGDKGRTLFRFSETTGSLVEKRRLPEPSQGIVSFGSRIAFVAIRLRPRESMLVLEQSPRPVPFTPIRSRPGPNPVSTLIANLLRCGSGVADAMPCWFLAGSAEVLLVSANGRVRTVAVPTFATGSPSSPPEGPAGSDFRFPVRDVFGTAEGLWVLSNQEGERSPAEDGAVRSRHVVLVRPGGNGRAAETLELPREARAVLDADRRGVVLLYDDGKIDRVTRK